MKTIRRQLLTYLLGGMFVSILIAIFATYVEVRVEADELFDYQLKQIVAALPEQIPAGLILPADYDKDEQITVQVWNKNGDLVFASGPAQDMPRVDGFGFKSLKLNGKEWRIYSERNDARVIQASQLTHERDEVATGVAFRALTPFLVLMPLLAMLIWFVVGRGLSPLHQMASDVARRSPDALDALPDGRYPAELQPILSSLNNLLARLSQAISTQKAFIADAAHELRTPLAALKLQLQLIESDRRDLRESADFKKLHDRLNRATRLVKQLLVSARQERYIGERTLQAVDLKLLIADVIAEHLVQAESRKIDLGAVVADGAPAQSLVSGDERSLHIMLGNLVDNAIHYTPAGGRVDISVLQDATDQSLLLRVADNGPGIAQQDQARVFDRFYRGEGNDASGSGLGLHIVKTIAEQHHASITLGADENGNGLTVSVRFPPLPAQQDSSSIKKRTEPS